MMDNETNQIFINRLYISMNLIKQYTEAIQKAYNKNESRWLVSYIQHYKLQLKYIRELYDKCNN